MKTKIFILSLFFSFGFSSLAAKKDSRYFEITKNLDIFNSLFRELDVFYVDSIKPQELIPLAIDNMLYELDPYTVYIPESEFDDLKLMSTGEYGGVGAIITQRGDSILISDPYEGKPAQKAGIKAGDYLLEINGQSLNGKSVSQASELLRGQPGEMVKVKILRPGEKKAIVKEILRETIAINPVAYYAVYDSIAYIYLSGFTDKASAEFKKAFTEMKSKNDLKGLVIDLRGNPGGLITDAIDISGYFLPKGQEVMSTKGKNTQWDEVYKTSREPLDADIPIVVLVNDESASASEIVAGAFQDLDRAVIVGNKTFGKGLVQTTRPIGYNGYLKVTTAKYYTPSGRCIQAIDYENRELGNRAKKVADSLTHEFKTRNGRPVKDAGGITPDVELKQTETLNISHKLLVDFRIFDYATQYVRKHPHIASVKDFELTEADFEDFKQFLKSKDFSYELRSIEVLNKLKEIAKIEGYEELASKEFEALEQKLKPDTDKDIELHKQEIKKQLSVEIVKRYYYQKGGMQEALKTDEGLEKALEILKDNNQYHSILKKK